MPHTNLVFNVKIEQMLLKKKDAIPHGIVNISETTPFFQVCGLEPNMLDEFP